MDYKNNLPWVYITITFLAISSSETLFTETVVRIVFETWDTGSFVWHGEEEKGDLNEINDW